MEHEIRGVYMGIAPIIGPFVFSPFDRSIAEEPDFVSSDTLPTVVVAID